MWAGDLAGCIRIPTGSTQIDFPARCSQQVSWETTMQKLPSHEVSSGNMFADLELPDAQELLVKSGLVSELSHAIKVRRLSHAKAAALLGVAPAELSDILRGRFGPFSIERLMRMLTAFGRDVEIIAKPARRARGPGNIRFKRAAA